MDELLRQQDTTGPQSSEEVACRWVRHARDVWEAWVPELRQGKTPVYLGGMFPMSTGGDAVWSRPGLYTGKLGTSRVPDFILNVRKTFQSDRYSN